MERRKKTLRDAYCFCETRDRCYWRRIKVIEEHREHATAVETKMPLICYNLLVDGVRVQGNRYLYERRYR